MSGDRSPSSPFFFSSPSYGSEVPVLLPLQETLVWSTFLYFSRRGGVSHGCCCTPGAVTSLLAGGRVAASNPASSSATALSPRLAAAPPMPSSLAPSRCSEATPDELEQRLRFYARQIESFRRTSLLYSSPELWERIRQMEDYETAVRQFYCRPPSPTLSHKSAAAVQSTSCLQTASAAAAEQSMSGFLIAADAAQLMPCLLTATAVEQPTPGLVESPELCCC
ncbi:hypothetical protein ILYODFUR_034213 [Ilyodon furcidens]|uniref:Uncharacterized protein n=1 Tax=Ilyodon furcidens TaxID=33524 RepID=A0ABV0VLU3_9TELE